MALNVPLQGLIDRSQRRHSTDGRGGFVPADDVRTRMGGGLEWGGTVVGGPRGWGGGRRRGRMNPIKVRALPQFGQVGDASFAGGGSVLVNS